MAVDFKKTSYAGSTPVFWRGECKALPGGFRLLQTFPKGTVLNRGALVCVNFNTMEAGIVKTAKVVGGGTTAAPRVAKGTLFIPGDMVFKQGEATGKTVSAIDRSNADYDVLTLNSALTGLAEGDFLLETANVTAAALRFESNAVLESTKEIQRDADETVSAGYEAAVLSDMTYPVPDAWKQGICLKNNPNIVFINQ